MTVNYSLWAGVDVCMKREAVPFTLGRLVERDSTILDDIEIKQ